MFDRRSHRWGPNLSFRYHLAVTFDRRSHCWARYASMRVPAIWSGTSRAGKHPLILFRRRLKASCRPWSTSRFSGKNRSSCFCELSMRAFPIPSSSCYNLWNYAHNPDVGVNSFYTINSNKSYKLVRHMTLPSQRWQSDIKNARGQGTFWCPTSKVPLGRLQTARQLESFSLTRR